MLLFMLINQVLIIYGVKHRDTVDLTKCKVTHLGTEYIGRKFVTELNETCQYWSSSIEKEGKDLDDTSFPDGSKSLAKNYCRNPNNAKTGPWCYTGNKNLVTDSCAIPLCRSTLCRVTGPGMEYAGNITKSASGRKCAKWRSPHGLKKKKKKKKQQEEEEKFKDIFFSDGSARDADNKCRNPDGKTSGPWCHVEKEDSELDEAELCDIPFCDDVDPVIYSESNVQAPHFFFSSFNITSSIKFGVRLWDEKDWLRGKVHILLSGIDVAGNRSDIRRWNSGLELVLSNTASELRTGDEIELQESPHILSAMNWTNVEITWVVDEDDKMLVQVFLNRNIKPLLLTEIDLRDKILELTSFRYFSLSGSSSLWNISADDEECNVHTTLLLEYTRFWLMRRTSLGPYVDLYVRAVGQAVILFRAAPMMITHQVQIVIGDGDKIKVAYYSEDNTYVVIKESAWPKLLDLWKWENFKINFLNDRLQVYWTKLSDVELLMDVTHPRLAGVVWVTFASRFVSYWTIYCNPKGMQNMNWTVSGVSDPPSAVPPECVGNEKDDFNGTQSVTKAGHQCIPWVDDEAVPERYRKTELYEYYGGRAACRNFCRNLDKVKKGSFCIVKDASTNNFVLEYCYPRLCHLGECKIAGTGNDYTGTLNRTRSKRDCRSWTDFSNDPLISVDNFPDPAIEDAKNYCRNPDKKTGGLWCYVKDPQIEVDYCFIKDCDKPLECTILSSGFSSGHNIFILPKWRKNGLNFWLKTWNPDIYEGFKIKLTPLRGDRSYVLAIGDEGNEKLKFFYETEEDDYGEELLVKTLPHLVPAGKWGGFWLRPGEGKVELGYQDVSDPFFEWTSPDESKTFDPAFIDFGTISGHWIGVNFLCSECILEETSSENARRIYPINLWKADSSGNFRRRLTLNFRGMASLAIILMTNPGFDEYIAIKLSSDWDEISIWEFKWNYSNRKLVEYEVTTSFSRDHWTEYKFSFQENSISLEQDKTHIFKWQSHWPLLLYWFSIQVYEGSLIWSANCPPADIDGPPRNGHWGAWGPWTCSVTCGGGQGRTERKCDSPAPNVFGRECKGSAIYDGPCNTFPCGQISPGTSDLIRFHLSTRHTALEAQTGTKVVLQCNSRGLISKEIKNISITWLLNGFPYSRRRARINKEYSLVIPKTSEKDSGVYLCMALQIPGGTPSKLVLDVVSLVVNSTTPTKKVRKGKSFSLKCKGLALSYVYGDLSQKWEVNGTVWKDYGITTLETAADDKVNNVTEEHDGIWTCVITQPDLNFKWITNWMLIKVDSSSNFWIHLQEDAATAPLFNKFGSEKNVKIAFFVALATILVIGIMLTITMTKILRSKKT